MWLLSWRKEARKGSVKGGRGGSSRAGRGAHGAPVAGRDFRERAGTGSVGCPRPVMPRRRPGDREAELRGALLCRRLALTPPEWTGRKETRALKAQGRINYKYFFSLSPFLLGLPGWLRWLRIRLQCRRSRFDPWVGKMPWGRERLPTPVFLPGASQGQRSLAGYRPWGHRVHTAKRLTLLGLNFISYDWSVSVIAWSWLAGPGKPSGKLEAAHRFVGRKCFEWQCNFSRFTALYRLMDLFLKLHFCPKNFIFVAVAEF